MTAAAGAGMGVAPTWPHKRIGSATADATVLLPVVEAKTCVALASAIAAARVELAALGADTQLRRMIRWVGDAAAEVLSGQSEFTYGVHEADPVHILRHFIDNAPLMTTTRSDCALLLGLLKPFGVLDAIMRDVADVNSPVFSLSALQLPGLAHAVLDMADADDRSYPVPLTPILRAMHIADAGPTTPESHQLVHRLGSTL